MAQSARAEGYHGLYQLSRRMTTDGAFTAVATTPAAALAPTAAVAGWVRQREGRSKVLQQSPGLRRGWLLLWQHPHFCHDAASDEGSWFLLLFDSPASTSAGWVAVLRPGAAAAEVVQQGGQQFLHLSGTSPCDATGAPTAAAAFDFSIQADVRIGLREAAGGEVRAPVHPSGFLDSAVELGGVWPVTAACVVCV